MRCVTLAMAATLVIGATLSSSDISNMMDLLKSDILAQKESLVRGAMVFEPGEAQEFWPLYHDYALGMDEVWSERLELVRQYADAYPNPSGELADRLITRSLVLDQKALKLRKKYYRKIRSATSDITAARFLQIDRRIDNLNEIRIGQEIPLFN